MSKKSKFDLSHERKLSFNMGELIPIMCEAVLPADRWRVKSEIMLRMAPLLAPIMHRVNIYTHFFFVPNRLIWNEWQDFITGGKNGDLAPQHPFFAFPIVSAPDRSVNGSLADYLGLPTNPQSAVVTNTQNISVLPFRAYQLIYNEYYRDQNLTDPVAFGLGSGPIAGQDLLNITTKRSRAWEKDYFTSALPWAQRGGAAIAPLDQSLIQPAITRTGSGSVPNSEELFIDASGNVVNKTSGQPIQIQTLGTDSGIEINELRKANAVQKWLERNARAGARYIEVLLSQFKVRSSDARLQRPEYLGGGRNPIVISEVLSTMQVVEPTGPYPQGHMAGHGIGVGNVHGFSRSFEEHGYVIGIMSVLPKTAYQQGIRKDWQRFDKFDYPWPVFAHLGEQEVKSTEIFHDAEAAQAPPTTFGYQERYAECKYGFNTVHGNFRDNLAYWHMGRVFNAQPALNESFVTSDPTTRIFAVENADEHHLYAQVYNAVDALRPLPFFGTPRL